MVAAMLPQTQRCAVFALLCFAAPLVHAELTADVRDPMAAKDPYIESLVDNVVARQEEEKSGKKNHGYKEMPKDWKPLHKAARAGDLKWMDEIKEEGGDLNVKEKGGLNPAHFAALGGSDKAMKWLLVNGANLQDQDSHGLTPAHWAAQNGHTKVLKVLIENDIAYQMVDRQGFTPVHDAAKKGHSKVIRLLAESGANVSKPDMFYHTPLHYGAKQGHSKVVKALFESKANLDTERDAYGETVAHMAAKANSTKVLQLIKDLGADLFIMSDETEKGKNNGKLPFHYAKTSKMKRIIREKKGPTKPVTEPKKAEL